MSDLMTFGIGFFIFICAFGIGYFTKQDALKFERAECERLRKVIFNSRAKKESERDGSGYEAICTRAHFPHDGGSL